MLVQPENTVNAIPTVSGVIVEEARNSLIKPFLPSFARLPVALSGGCQFTNLPMNRHLSFKQSNRSTRKKRKKGPSSDSSSLFHNSKHLSPEAHLQEHNLHDDPGHKSHKHAMISRCSNPSLNHATKTAYTVYPSYKPTLTKTQ